MATISGYDSASIGVLFSSLNNNNRSGNGMSDLLGINYSDYATIRNGSYFKLMKAYYTTGASDEISSIAKDKTNTSTSKDDTKAIAIL